MTRNVFLIGALPPPVHGFSAVTAAMADRLKEKCNVLKINRTPHFRFKHKYLSVINLPFHFFLLIGFFSKCLSKKSKSFYFGLSGGLGLYIDILFLMVIRLVGGDLVLHHHNFTYINYRYRSIDFILKLHPRAKHIFLCDCMRDKFLSRYKDNVPVGFDGIIVSNHAFVENSTVQSLLVSQSPLLNKEIKLGFLSNITLDKGIFEFLRICDYFENHGYKVSAVIGGPISSGSVQEILHEFAIRDYVDYRGGLYGPDKRKFFSEINFLVFPSKYVNEAEPLVVIEAMSYGIPVISSDIGCLSGLVVDELGISVDLDDDTWCETILKFVSKADIEASLARRQGVFDANVVRANKQVDLVIDFLIG